MSEYIVEYPAWADDCIDIESCLNVHERIVRCEECREYVAFDKSSRLGGYGLCEQFESKKLGTSIATANGFCAWGIPREG